MHIPLVASWKYLVNIPLTYVTVNSYGRWRPAVIRSLNGVECIAWEPTMPRLDDELLETSIYLYPTVEDARAGEGAGGSGFLVVYPSGIGPDFLYAISNWHVVVNAPVVRVNSSNDNFDVIPLGQENWIKHPDRESDIAVAPLALDPTRHQFRGMPIKGFLTQEFSERFDIGVGDDVALVGRFVNREGQQRNRPAARFGMIAQMPGEKVYNEVGAQEAFIAEIRSIAGYSGSPVCVLLSLNRDEKINRDIEERTSADQIGELRFWLREFQGPKVTFLLGIDCGHIYTFEDVYEQDRKTKTDFVTKANTGMAIIIPAWKIAEQLEMKQLRRMRKEAIEKYQVKMEGVASDSATAPTQKSHPRKGSAIDIPIPTKSEVTDVFKKVTRKRKPS